jgi:signal recognition particle subunit SRP54
MAQRILGMGDILALVEEAQKSVDLAEAQKMADKLKKGGGFDLNDFKMQMTQMKKMGGLSGLIDKLPAQMQAAAGQANASRVQY